MDLGLSGRVAIVAAASKGLGRAVAEESRAKGRMWRICARTAGALEETAAQIQKATGREVFQRALDVTIPRRLVASWRMWKRALAASISALPIPGAAV